MNQAQAAVNIGVFAGIKGWTIPRHGQNKAMLSNM